MQALSSCYSSIPRNLKPGNGREGYLQEVVCDDPSRTRRWLAVTTSMALAAEVTLESPPWNEALLAQRRKAAFADTARTSNCR